MIGKIKQYDKPFLKLRYRKLVSYPQLPHLDAYPNCQMPIATYMCTLECHAASDCKNCFCPASNYLRPACAQALFRWSQKSTIRETYNRTWIYKPPIVRSVAFIKKMKFRFDSIPRVLACFPHPFSFALSRCEPRSSDAGKFCPPPKRIIIEMDWIGVSATPVSYDLGTMNR